MGWEVRRVVNESGCREQSLKSKRRNIVETSIMSREQYHERMLEMIAENLKGQGYTKEKLKQYNLDRDNGMSETDAMARLHRSSAA